MMFAVLSFKPFWEDSTVTFLCTIYSQDSTFGAGDSASGASPATLVGTAAVVAANPRQAAAKGYVRCVGKQRAWLLKEVLHAPKGIVRHETDWKALAPGLMRSQTRFGDCYSFDNLVETWYIKVEPTCLPVPSRRLSRRRRLLFRSLRHPSPN
jgi:hypothetical protein